MKKQEDKTVRAPIKLDLEETRELAIALRTALSMTTGKVRVVRDEVVVERPRTVLL
jgi:hypothetical protein